MGIHSAMKILEEIYKSKFLYVYLWVLESKISIFILHLKLALKRATSQDVILN